MLSYYFNQQLEYIQLRSIESISNEEVRILGFSFKSLGGNKNRKAYFLKAFEVIGFSIFSYNQMLMLKRIGIATPSMSELGREITVDELVESGKLKLI